MKICILISALIISFGANCQCNCSDVLTQSRIDDKFYDREYLLHYALSKYSQMSDSEESDDLLIKLGDLGIGKNDKKKTASIISSLTQNLKISEIESYVEQSYIPDNAIDKWAACMKLKNELTMYTKETGEANYEYTLFVNYGGPNHELAKVTSWKVLNAVDFADEATSDNFGLKRFRGEREIQFRRESPRETIRINLALESSTGNRLNKAYDIPPVPLKPIAKKQEGYDNSGYGGSTSNPIVVMDFVTSNEHDQVLLMVFSASSKWPESKYNASYNISHQALRVRKADEPNNLDEGWWGSPSKKYSRYETRTVPLERNTKYVAEGYVGHKQFPVENIRTWIGFYLLNIDDYYGANASVIDEIISNN